MSLYRYSGWMMSYGVIFRVFSLLYSCDVRIDEGDNALLLSVYYLRSSTAMKGFSRFGDRNLSNLLVVSRDFGDRFCGHSFFGLKSSFFNWIDHLTSGEFQTCFFPTCGNAAILSNIYIIFCNWAETTSHSKWGVLGGCLAWKTCCAERIDCWWLSVLGAEYNNLSQRHHKWYLICGQLCVIEITFHCMLTLPLEILHRIITFVYKCSTVLCIESTAHVQIIF